MKSVITKTILLLSVVSLLADVSSEMLYPVMPLFLQSIGFTAVMIGVFEGIAEAVAGLSKIYFGNLSDALGKRMPFVRTGYALSGISKSMMALFVFPAWIFAARSMDRLGKGLRTGARDAMLSDETMPDKKATVFGFHRAMDTLGAAMGPAVALIWLHFHPGEYRVLFLLAFLPALLSIALTFIIREKKLDRKIYPSGSFFEKFRYWNRSPATFKKLMAGLLFFALINSTDLFLLLRAKEITGSDQQVLTIYIFYNLVYALAAFPAGRLADRLGMKTMIVFGMVIFALVYFGMAITQNATILFLLMAMYGIHAAATEGVAKALISNVVPREQTASAIGFYAGWNSIAALISSSAAGLIWYNYSAEVMLLITSLGAAAAAGYLRAIKIPNQPYNSM
jgi:MFS family permease